MSRRYIKEIIIEPDLKLDFIGTLTLTFPHNGPNSKDVFCTPQKQDLIFAKFD